MLIKAFAVAIIEHVRLAAYLVLESYAGESSIITSKRDPTLMKMLDHVATNALNA